MGRRFFQIGARFGGPCVMAAAATSILLAQQVRTTVTTPSGGQITVTAQSPAELDDAVRRAVSSFEAGRAAGLAAAQGAAPPRNTPPLKTGTSQIRGQIVGTNGLPLREASVIVSGSELGGSKTVTTEADGRYAFDNLPAGHFAVTAVKPNFIQLNYGQADPYDVTRLIDLAAGQRVDGVNIALPRGGVIAGRVLDEYGEPVTDLQVVPMRKLYSQGQLQPMPTGRAAMTNDIGEYRIFGLPPGQYFVSVTAHPVITSSDDVERRTGYAPTYYPSTPVFANAVPVTVGAGETVNGIDLSLVVTRLATISGSVLSSLSATPRAGNVTAFSRAGNTAALNGSPVRSDGTFTVAPLPPGDYVLRATMMTPLPSPLPTAPGFATRAPDSSEILIGYASVNGADVAGVVLTPLRRVNVTGRIVFDALNGRQPQSSMIRLNILPRSTEATLALVGQPITINPDFSFQVAVPAAEIAFRALVAMPEWVVKTIKIGNLDVTDSGVDLRNAQDITVEVELTNHPPEITGTVTGASGEPLKEFTILALPEDRQLWIPDSRLVVTVRSDAQGRYRIRTLPPGRYFIVVVDNRQTVNVLDPDFLDHMRARAASFSLTDGEVKTLDLRFAPTR